MYVPQSTATVIYTIFKTVLLILLAKAVESLCSWVNRYDLAKIMEHGSYSVLYTTIFTRNYRNYMTFVMIFLLFLMISFETVINLLPAIATQFMPFQLVSFKRGDDEMYFKAIYATPPQSAAIPSSINHAPESDPMRQYCEAMNLCKSDGSYITNTLKISPTMQVSAVPYNFDSAVHKFITDTANVSTEYCELRDNTQCISGARFAATEASHNLVAVPGFPFDVLTYFNTIDESATGAAALMEAAKLQLQYNHSEVSKGDYVDRSPIIRMLYLPTKNDILSVTHLSKLLYSNGRQAILLVQKVALHNLSPEGSGNGADYVPMFGDVFNNSQMLYNISLNHTNTLTGPGSNYSALSNITMGAAYTSYIYNNYVALDYLQRTMYAGTTEAILKIRMLTGVYVIVDDLLPEHDPTLQHAPFLTNYNATRFENKKTSRTGFRMREPGFYDSMLDGFQDQPKSDLFMYALLNGSESTMYGVKGYQEVVADISPIFVALLSGIIVLLLSFFLFSKFTRNQLYFYTLYQTIGHTYKDGCIYNPNDEIPPISLKDGVVYVGDKIVAVENKDAFWTDKHHVESGESTRALFAFT